MSRRGRGRRKDGDPGFLYWLLVAVILAPLALFLPELMIDRSSGARRTRRRRRAEPED